MLKAVVMLGIMTGYCIQPVTWAVVTV